MKKILVIAVCFLLAIALVACSAPAQETQTSASASTEAIGEATQEASAGAKTEGKGVSVGYSCNNFNDTFQTYIVDAAQAAADENGINLQLQDAQEDVIKQQDQVKAMIADGVKGLIVVPVDTSATQPITDAAKEAGIPLCYVNRNPFGEEQPPENVYYVGSNEPDAGKLQAEELMKLLPDGGNVCILQGLLSNEGAIKRTEGFMNAIDTEKYKVLATEAADWQRDKGMTTTENWLTTFGEDLNVIISNNDEMALGAAQAAQAAGRSDIIIMGVDASPDGKQAVVDGKLAATVLQDAVNMGGGAIKLINEAVAGGKPEAVTWVPFSLLTPDNVKDAM